MANLVPGVYERLLTDRLAGEIARLPTGMVHGLSRLDPGEAHELLARHVHDQLLSVLQAMSREQGDALPDQIALSNLILEAIAGAARTMDAADPLLEPSQVLGRVYQHRLGVAPPEPPFYGLSTSTLILNDGENVGLSAVLKRELLSADSVDLICAFINHNGVRILLDEFRGVCGRGQLRIVTTTYMGATQRRALDELVDLGARVKVAYETPPTHTKLHAKAWLMKRATGYDTALVGSSNISHSALMDGLEWNVRLTRVDTPHVIKHFQTTFDRYWSDSTFEDYEPGRDAERLDRALEAPRSGASALVANIEVTARPHQVDILESLDADRERGKYKSLVVAATGTGKTVVAALDYKRLRRRHQDLKLLFVAHRREILEQSALTFRAVLRDGGFGEDWVDGRTPSQWRHVFASIQTIHANGVSRFAADHFDMVIVDEFHHAMAETYQALLKHVCPRYLLGLTATPERTDGRSVAELFEGASTTELRLWDALDEGILCPFQYFAINDDVDLQQVSWEGGKYRVSELEQAYVARGEHRAALVFENVRRIVADWTSMRALGFCVSKRHAEFMAQQFQQFGASAAYVTADTPGPERDDLIRRLRDGELQVLFAVDLFNEGVDIPEVDTVLFLRPTESATVFIQQLGRGLRLCEGKPCLTALDFVGMHNTRFRFDLRLRAMTGQSRAAVARQVEEGFTHLPLGCTIEMDEIAKGRVLANLRAALPSNTRRLVEELRSLAGGRADYPLAMYLAETGLDYDDLYRSDRCYTALKRQAGLLPCERTDAETSLGARIARLTSIADVERLRFYNQLLAQPECPRATQMTKREQRMLYMLLYALFTDTGPGTLDASLRRLWAEPAIGREIVELTDLLYDVGHTVTHQIEVPDLADVPLRTHGTYTRDEVIAAMGIAKPSSMREGVRWCPEYQTDVLFVTLRKTESEYSITTLYDDRVVSPTEFHWESQSGTREGSPTGQRYISHEEQGSTVLLFVREARKGDQRTQPYLCAGPVHYLRHEGECPMRITWRLEVPLPAAVYPRLKAAAG